MGPVPDLKGACVEDGDDPLLVHAAPQDDGGHRILGQRVFALLVAREGCPQHIRVGQVADRAALERQQPFDRLKARLPGCDVVAVPGRHGQRVLQVPVSQVDPPERQREDQALLQNGSAAHANVHFTRSMMSAIRS
jgi:hypothetical protein